MTTSTTKPNADKSTHNLKIDGMKSDADVTKVRGALVGVSGVQTRSVKIGSASIESDQSARDAACKAVTGVGFKAEPHTGNNPTIKG